MKPQKPVNEYLRNLQSIYRFLDEEYNKNNNYPLVSECSENLNMEETDLRDLTRDQDNILCLLDNKTRLGFPKK